MACVHLLRLFFVVAILLFVVAHARVGSNRSGMNRTAFALRSLPPTSLASCKSMEPQVRSSLAEILERPHNVSENGLRNFCNVIRNISTCYSDYSLTSAPARAAPVLPILRKIRDSVVALLTICDEPSLQETYQTLLPCVLTILTTQYNYTAENTLPACQISFYATTKSSMYRILNPAIESTTERDVFNEATALSNICCGLKQLRSCGLSSLQGTCSAEALTIFGTHSSLILNNLDCDHATSIVPC